MLKTSIMMSLISILGFTTGKIRFQVVRNSLVIPTMCRAARSQNNVAVTAGLMAIVAGVRKITIRILPPTFNADGGPTVVAVTRRDDGGEAAPVDCTFRHAQFIFAR
jgi:hypothetical protein